MARRAASTRAARLSGVVLTTCQASHTCCRGCGTAAVVHASTVLQKARWRRALGVHVVCWCVGEKPYCMFAPSAMFIVLSALRRDRRSRPIVGSVMHIGSTRAKLNCLDKRGKRNRRAGHTRVRGQQRVRATMQRREMEVKLQRQPPWLVHNAERSWQLRWPAALAASPGAAGSSWCGSATHAIP